MVQVSIPGGAINQDIIEENDDEFAKKWLQQIIHGCLKGRGGVAKAERHDSKLIMAHVCAKSSFMDISLVHSDLMESLTKIQLGEPLRTA